MPRRNRSPARLILALLLTGGCPETCADAVPSRSGEPISPQLILDRVDQARRVPITDVGAVEAALDTTFDSYGHAEATLTGFTRIEYTRDHQHASVRMYLQPDVCVTRADLSDRLGSLLFHPYVPDHPDGELPVGEGTWVAAKDPRLRARLDLETGCLLWIGLVQEI